MGEECGAADRRLRDEIGQLRAEITLLRTLLQASQEAARLRSEISDLKAARGVIIDDLPSLRPGGH